jgi:hypothetical protein
MAGPEGSAEVGAGGGRAEGRALATPGPVRGGGCPLDWAAVGLLVTDKMMLAVTSAVPARTSMALVLAE